MSNQEIPEELLEEIQLKTVRRFEPILNSIPRQTQRQDSLSNQLRDLIAVGNPLGLYDAADRERRLLE